MARSARLGAWAAAVLLLGTACTLLQHQPWHGPVILSLSSSHGINAGDIPALALFALGLALATGLLRGRDAPAGNRPAIRFATPACAVAVGALLLTGVFDEESPAEPLLPAGGGTVGGAIQRLESDRSGGIAHLAHRLAEQELLRPDATEAEATDVLWLLSGFESFDALFTGRGLGAHEVAERLIAMAERTLYRKAARRAA